MYKSSNITYSEFAPDKLRAFEKWMKYADVTTIDELKNMMVLEEFKRKVPSNIMLHLEDKQETNLLTAANLADNYALVHKSTPDHSMKRPNSNVKTSLGQSFVNHDNT